MGEVGDLRAHGVHDTGRGVADRGDGDALTEVDEPVAVDVLDDAAARARHIHRQGDADTVGYRCDPAFV